ncbi:hypothetical protein PHMEG_00020939 [Phytophthora megakarya]|uniref:ZSWIM1/3 RNaseH-like domain-containing protein n=1 Tax=Phytophthora megakarya TaxID=4795 RepID=A0A225VN52_9STRA|nr:hypothetical protein PHMEG_00020939 [Phytophthora megakarya]
MTATCYTYNSLVLVWNHIYELISKTFSIYPQTRFAIPADVVVTANTLQKLGPRGKPFTSTCFEKVATCLTMQTLHMREAFASFSEVLLIDATHGTNEIKYKLNNPKWRDIQCVIVDKDFTELAALKTALPGVRVLLCQFHVIKYLSEEGASSKEQLISCIRLLVYASREREFEKHRKYLTHLINIGSCSRRSGAISANSGISNRDSQDIRLSVNAISEVNNANRDLRRNENSVQEWMHRFKDYFVRNWDTCKDMFSYTRQNALTLGNNTNNRLEASWKQIKDIVNGSMGMDESVALIMLYQSRTEQ